MKLPFAARVFWALLCLLVPTESTLASPAHPSVLIVHSYSAENTWTQQINAGIKAGLAGLSLQRETVYMDAKRHPDEASLQIVAASILETIRRLDPDVVIAVDDAAQDHLVVPYLRGLPRPQVIVCGVNAPFSKYGYPARNVSGVRGRWHYRDGFALLKKIAPHAGTVAFLVEDSETGGYAVADLLDDKRQNGAYALHITVVEKVRTFQHWQRLIRSLQKRVGSLALPLYHSLRDEKTGAVVPPEQVMAWTNSVNKLPTVGFVDYAQNHGLLCGVLASGEEQGHLAGDMALAVLSTGKPAGTFPVQRNRRGVVMVNLKAARKLGISIPYEIIEAAGIVVQ